MCSLLQSKAFSLRYAYYESDISFLTNAPTILTASFKEYEGPTSKTTSLEVFV